MPNNETDPHFSTLKNNLKEKNKRMKIKIKIRKLGRGRSGDLGKRLGRRNQGRGDLRGMGRGNREGEEWIGEIGGGGG